MIYTFMYKTIMVKGIVWQTGYSKGNATL